MYFRNKIFKKEGVAEKANRGG